MHGKSAHRGAWSLFAGLALVGLLLVGACAKHVPQDKATGSDGKIKGARPIELDNGEAKVRGIVTYPGGDRIDWRSIELPKDQVPPADHLRRVLGDWVVDVAHSQNLVILRTPPGSAHVVASVLDRSSLPEVLGTVAGDDTLIIVADEDVPGSTLADQLRELAGLA